MKNNQLATFGGGCFWCIEAIIQRLNGVEKVVSGYTGGHIKGKPTYREVCSGLTGHAEVVQVTFDPDIISYHDLITIFMTNHNPTQLNRQGADHGSQYRSVIFYHSPEQKNVAQQVISELKTVFDDPIVTELSELDVFYDAEDYHQDYYNKNPNRGYCHIVIDPKVNKLRNNYVDKMKSQEA